MTAARLLDLAAGAALVALGAALLLWTGRPEHWWARPEHVLLLLLGLVAARLLVAPVAVPAWRPRRVVAIGVGLYALLFSFVTVTRHLTFQTHALDLGYYVQLAWNLARGRGPYVSLPEMHAWGDHLSPIMYAFAPAFWVVPGPISLLVAQSLALGLGGVAVFAFARRRLGDDRPAAAFALLYLANPSLHGINVRDFHAAALAIPLLLAAIYFVEAGRPVWFAVAAGLALLCREDAAIALSGLGVWVALGRRRWLPGVALAAAGPLILWAEVRWLMPAYRGEPYPHFGRYAWLGESLGEILAAPLLRPLHTVGGLLTADRLVYLVAMLAPLGFLPLLARGEILAALPVLLQNLLSSDPVVYHHRAQYQAFLLPFLVLAAVAGYARLAARRRAGWPVAVLVVAMLLSLTLAARTANNLAVARWWPTAEQRAVHALLGRVPSGAAVSAQDPYVAHLALRERVAVFPVAIEGSDHLVLNAATYPWRNLPGITLEREGATVTITLPGRREFRYEVTGQVGPHLLLRRVG